MTRNPPPLAKLAGSLASQLHVVCVLAGLAVALMWTLSMSVIQTRMMKQFCVQIENTHFGVNILGENRKFVRLKFVYSPDLQ